MFRTDMADGYFLEPGRLRRRQSNLCTISLCRTKKHLNVRIDIVHNAM